ncbi:MAG: hypothetical protein HY056_10990 [Proteobacteria bacterium]|nr:hypothetical protein [Pseudomonadota bacterium]
MLNMIKEIGLRATAFVAPGGKHWRRALLILPALAALGGCGATIGEALPTRMGGLSAGAPARSSAPEIFPAVHDMPPEREIPVLSTGDIKKTTAELATQRDQQIKDAQRPSAKRRYGRQPEPQ